MFTSLRSRLWLTYAVLVVVVLGIVFVGLVLYLLNNPLADRQASLRMEVIVTELVNRTENNLQTLPRERLFSLLERQAQALDVRLLLVDSSSQIVFDTQSSTADPLTFSPFLLERNQGQVRDTNLRVWLYARRLVTAELSLIAAVPRANRLTILARLAEDNLFRPFFQATLVALLLSLLLALLIARWVAAPLQNMARAAGEISGETNRQKYPPRLPLEGPQEVRWLAGAFNQMTERLYTSQQIQRDFVANVSHELKTPLTSIQGFAQAIQDGTVDSPDGLKKAAEIIYTEANRMYRLVLDLLDLARYDAGIIEIHALPLDLNDLLTHLVTKFQPQAARKDIRLIYTPQKLPGISADGDRLSQVFSNLVDNAIHHSAPGGQVEINSLFSTNQLEVQVKDSGPGIPASDLPRIFERFYQVDKSRQSSAEHGSGLGLAIAREIILAHGGTLTVTSQPAQGSTFVVKLPFVTGAVASRRTTKG